MIVRGQTCADALAKAAGYLREHPTYQPHHIAVGHADRDWLVWIYGGGE